MTKHFNTYIELHLGDNVRHLDYLKKIINCNKDYYFTHYAKFQYIGELQMQLLGYESNIVLKSLEDNILPYDSINAWIGSNNWFYIYEQQNLEYPLMYDLMYIEWYNYLEKTYKLPNPIHTPEEFLSKFPSMDVYDINKQYDVLIINSQPNSGQYYYEEDLFKKLAYHLIDQGYNIITTKKIDNVECTLDYNYNLIQIAKISTKAAIIIAIDTGPVHLCLNKLTLENCKFFHILHKNNSYSFDKITCSQTLNTIQF